MKTTRLNAYLWLLVAVSFLCALPAGAGTPASLVLEANFDDKVEDEPIGIGGAAVGEPVFVSSALDAIVRKEQGSDSNLELELTVQASTNTSSVRFEFLDSFEATSGVINLQQTVVLNPANDFNWIGIYLREQGGSSRSFANLQLRSSGVAELSGSGFSDINWSGELQVPGRNQVELEADMDRRRLWLWINTELVTPLEGVELGILDRGIGRIITVMGAHTSTRQVRVDDLLVSWIPSERIFASGFESP